MPTLRPEAEVKADMQIIEARMAANRDNNDIQRQLRSVWLRLEQDLQQIAERKADAKTAREAELNVVKTEMQDIKKERTASQWLKDRCDEEIEEIEEQKLRNSNL